MNKDAAKIAEDRLLAQNGANLKAKVTLKLNKYLIRMVAPDILGINAVTTPITFGKMADETFERLWEIKL